jgi:arsenate reductase
MSTQPPSNVLSVLFLCTGNSARSQIAEALLATRGKGRFSAGSAGVLPASRVNPFAVEILHDYGIDWSGRVPKTIDDVRDMHWDFVITVCDRAKESCPIFPGNPTFAHWGMEDPAEVQGDDAEKRAAFRITAVTLARRIDLLLALPMATLEKRVRDDRVRSIGVSANAVSSPASESANR